MTNEKQIKSKERVAEHGEVFTAEREVNAMLDLVKQETERIDSTFLEPACGNGNFLVEILRRKLELVHSDCELVQAVCSIYGVDIMQDNVEECRERLLEIIKEWYAKTHKGRQLEGELMQTIRYVLECNILLGDALSMCVPGEYVEDTFTVGGKLPKPIEFSQWAFIGDMVNRRNYTLNGLLTQPNRSDDLPLFNDLNEPVSMPQPCRNYEPIYYLKLYSQK